MANDGDDAEPFRRNVAVICDPEAAPAEIGRHLARVLPALLEQQSSNGERFDVSLLRERLPAGRVGDHGQLVEHAADLLRRRDWDAVICLTDLPLRGARNEPLVVDLAIASGVAVFSLPAFGATRLRRRVTDVVLEILPELLTSRGEASRNGAASVALSDRDLPGPFRLVTPDIEGVDAQVVASRGMLRQLIGMVRSNRPWRLWLGLRGAVVAALAFSALWVINPTVWQLGVDHSFPRLILISASVVFAIVTWLILYHHLWVVGHDDTEDRRQAFLFNASTIITLGLGVSIAFVGLFALNLAAAHLVLSENVVAKQLKGPPGFVDYVKLCWMATAGASVVGGLGAGFESEEAVREAAYSQREAERRKQWSDRANRGNEQSCHGGDAEK